MSKIYCFDLSMKEINVEVLKDKIPVFLCEKVFKYQIKEDRLRSGVGYYLLTKILKEEYHIDLFKEDIKENQFGKIDLDTIHFNISHSKNLVALIVSNYACGIDVELINPNFDVQKMAKRILNIEEWNEYLLNQDKEVFYRAWTKKEAYFKYLGSGIKIRDLKENINPDLSKSIIIYDNDKNQYCLTSFVEDEVEYINIKEWNDC